MQLLKSSKAKIIACVILILGGPAISSAHAVTITPFTKFVGSSIEIADKRSIVIKTAAEIAWELFLKYAGSKTAPKEAPPQNPGALLQPNLFPHPVNSVIPVGPLLRASSGILAAQNNFNGWSYYYESTGQLYSFSARDQSGREDFFWASGWRVAN
jgi:hypothetical protein